MLLPALFLALSASPAWADWPWPVDGADWEHVEAARHLSNDIDGGGTADKLVEFHVRGNGYRSWLTCIHHGETGDRACAEFRATNYGHFRGYRVFTEAPGPAVKLLQAEIPSCAPADAEDPGQASMWLLHPEHQGRKLTWHRGRMLRQSPTCLSVEQAQAFATGLAWFPKGDPARDAPAWNVVYEPNWRTGRFKHEPVEKRAADKRFRLFSHRHALVIYDKEKHRHAWIVNFEGHTSGGFKLDRWATIDRVDQDGRDLFNIVVKLGPKSLTLRLNIVHLLYGRRPPLITRG